jgi:hypothetical protein
VAGRLDFSAWVRALGGRRAGWLVLRRAGSAADEPGAEDKGSGSAWSLLANGCETAADSSRGKKRKEEQKRAAKRCVATSTTHLVMQQKDKLEYKSTVAVWVL